MSDPQDTGVVTEVPDRRFGLLHGLLAAAVVLVCLCVWAGFRAWEIDRSLGRAEVDITDLRADIDANQWSALPVDSDRLDRDATSASSETHDPIWALTRYVPWLGANPRAVSVLAQSLADVAHGAVTPLAQSRSVAVVQGHDAGLSSLIAALAADQPSVSSAVAIVDSASAKVQGIHTHRLLSFVSTRVILAQAKLARASKQIDDAGRLANVAPDLLGQDRPQTVLLLFQTPAEERGTDGLVGAWGELRTDKGTVSLVGFGSIDTLADLPVAPQGVNPEIAADYGPDVQLPQNFNLSASFPDAARMFAASWTSGAGKGVVPDDVVTLDPIALASFLAVIGPVTTLSGEQITSANASDLLLRQQYVTYPGINPAPRIAFLGQVTQAVFAKISKPGYSVGELGRRIGTSSGQRRLAVWSANSADQAQWVALGLAGDLGTPSKRTVRVAVNSLDGSKLGAYLSTAITVSNTCTPGPLLTMTFSSSAPADIGFYPGTHVTGLDSSTMRLSYSVYLSTGWAVQSISVDGVKSGFSADTEGGWRLLRGSMDIPRATSRVVTVQLQGDTQKTQITTILAQPEAQPVSTHVLPTVTTNGSTCSTSGGSS